MEFSDPGGFCTFAFVSAVGAVGPAGDFAFTRLGGGSPSGASGDARFAMMGPGRQGAWAGKGHGLASSEPKFPAEESFAL